MPRLRASLAAWCCGLVLPVLAQQPGAPAPAAVLRQPPEAFTRPELGHCAACHRLPEGVGAASRAELGPKLEGERMRSLGKARLRAMIEDPVSDNADTVMPPFGRHRILDPAEIERLVEFLHALP